MKILQQFVMKSVMITGANRGIGLELIRYFVKQKKQLQNDSMKIISCARRMSPELESHLEDIYHVDLEVTDSVSVSKAANKVSDIVGNEGLNLLVNNAAIMKHKKGVVGCSDAELRETLDVNLIGVHSITNSFYPILKRAADFNSHIPLSCARAAVFNMSAEMGGIQNTKDSSATAYRISKAALNMLTKCTATEFVKDGIICVSVHPGWVRTDLGGHHAPMSTERSVKDIAYMIANCTEDHNGLLVRRKLKPVPF